MLSGMFASVCQTAVNTFWPPQCLGCRTPVLAYGECCPKCWQALDFIASPVCDCCGYPLAYVAGDKSRCVKCEASPPDFTLGRAVWKYDGLARQLLLRFKRHDVAGLAPALAGYMYRHGGRLLEGVDLVAPVPMHRRRFLQRGYNQSLLLAKHLSRYSGIPLAAGLLERVRHTPPQTGLSLRQRERNLSRAFAIAEDWRSRLPGSTILLIDDVHTTGATLRRSARVLRQGGAAEVRILTLARTVLD